jgi:hypothetical protein
MAYETSATIAYNSRTNTTISKPTGTVDGDFLLGVIYVEDDIAVTLPAGWTLIVTYDHPNTPFDIVIAYKRASSEGANWTWTHASASTSGFVARFSQFLNKNIAKTI